MIVIEPILDALVAVGLWFAFRRPDAVVNVHVDAPAVPEAPVPATTAPPMAIAPDQSRAAVLHMQPDGTWHEIGHAEGTRENPGERITRELATPDRAIRWPDGSIQES